MSTQDLQAFMKLAEEDSAIAEKVQAIGYDNLDGLIAYAGELNLTVDASDFAAMKDALLEQGHEISDDALEAVAGGWFFK